MNDSRHLPSGLSRNIPNLSVVWDLYERAHTHNSQCGCEHCAPYQYNSSIQTLGVASEKSIEIIIRVVKIDNYSINLGPAIILFKTTPFINQTIIVWKCVWNEVCTICVCKTIGKQLDIDNNDNNTKNPLLNYLLQFL